MKTFKELGLSAETLKVLELKGFETPTKIQEEAIPVMLNGESDIIGQAQTGTGKTAAFGLPIIELLKENQRNVQTLVLTPTRELAIQVAEELSSLKGKKRLTIVPIYGGQSITNQLRLLKKGVDIVVGTPGRVIDHIERNTLKLDNISFLVLDEADEMLNMGFLEDVNKILEVTGDNKRTFLFSATMPNEIVKIAKTYMGKYEHISVVNKNLTVSKTDQIYFEVRLKDKFEALCRIIDVEEDFYGLVFCRTKLDVDEVSHHLIERGYDVDGLHGDISQHQRERTLNKFKKRIVNILIATDVAARGIDVNDLTHVINYSLPQDPESYIHRIGRTGRAGKQGNAITFVTPSEYKKLQFIQRMTKADIKKAKLPNVKEVINLKKSKIKSEIEELVSVKINDQYLKMADELLKEHDSKKVIAGLLQHAFTSQLDEKNYVEISQQSSGGNSGSSPDLAGKTRLFVAHGRAEGLDKRSIIEFISENCNIKPAKIMDVQVLEKFSFVTMPFSEAEEVLSFFKAQGKKSKFFISKAKKSR